MENLNDMKKWFEKINSKIGSVIEMTPEVREILWTLYKEEEVLVKNIEVLSNEAYKIKYIFPPYTLSKEIPNHVSAMQMELAIIQWAFAALWLYIKNNPDKVPFDFEKFLQIRMKAKYREMKEKTFTKEIKPGESAYLIFDNIVIQKIKTFYTATVKLKWTPETFIRGEMKCVLEDKYL